MPHIGAWSLFFLERAFAVNTICELRLFVGLRFTKIILDYGHLSLSWSKLREVVIQSNFVFIHLHGV